jgi:DNA-binding transcriptional LysR family regulator
MCNTDALKQSFLDNGFAIIAKQVGLTQNQPMNLNLLDAELFKRVAELGNLSAVARERDEPVSKVSRAIVRLEENLGVQLLHRTTHGLSLTDAGDAFLSHARLLLENAQDLEQVLTGKMSQPSGWVRVSVSPIFAERLIVPSLGELYDKYPQLQIDLSADDRVVDLARDGIDMAIRAGAQISDTLVAVQIGEHGRGYFVSPEYAKKFGVPKVPAELEKHRLLANSASPTLNRWPLLNAQPSFLQVKGHTRVDNTSIMLSMTMAGIGIGRLNDMLARPLVAKGLLVPVLKEFTSEERIGIYAVMLQERQRLPKVRACIDFWREHLLRLA